jgi:hypothetical protein
MQEFRDGSFGGILPASLLIEQMARVLPDDLKAVHFGTAEELERIKKGKEAKPVIVPSLDASYVAERLDDLERRLNEATMQQHTQGVRVYDESALHKLEQKRS